MPNRVVYDSAAGFSNTCATCGKRLDRCSCGQVRTRAPQPAPPAATPPRDGIVRVMRDKKNRGGKTVTVVAGLPGGATVAAEVATELKRLCGTGGTVKSDTVEIQGDHRERIAEALRKRGYTVKLAGG